MQFLLAHGNSNLFNRNHNGPFVVGRDLVMTVTSSTFSTVQSTTTLLSSPSSVLTSPASPCATSPPSQKSPPSSPTVSSSPSGTSNSLSTGAKAGIGVGTIVGGLMIGLSVFYLSRSKGGTRIDWERGGVVYSDEPELDDLGIASQIVVPELDGMQIVAPMLSEPSELETPTENRMYPRMGTIGDEGMSKLGRHTTQLGFTNPMHTIGQSHETGVDVHRDTSPLNQPVLTRNDIKPTTHGEVEIRQPETSQVEVYSDPD